MVVPYYSIGSLNVNAGRIGNMVQAIFLILFSLNLLNLAIFIQENFRDLRYEFPEFSCISCLGTYLVLLVFGNSNYKRLYKDYRNGSYSKYKTELNKRLEDFKNRSEGNLILRKIQSPFILKHWEVSPDPEHWSNECYKDYLKKEL